MYILTIPNKLEASYNHTIGAIGAIETQENITVINMANWQYSMHC